MGEYYFSVNKDKGRVLCISPITDRILSMSEQNISDQSGYFLYEKDESEASPYIKIIAQVFSDEAALMLRNAFCMS